MDLLLLISDPTCTVIRRRSWLGSHLWEIHAQYSLEYLNKSSTNRVKFQEESLKQLTVRERHYIEFIMRWWFICHKSQLFMVEQFLYMDHPKFWWPHTLTFRGWSLILMYWRLSSTGMVIGFTPQQRLLPITPHGEMLAWGWALRTSPMILRFAFEFTLRVI